MQAIRLLVFFTLALSTFLIPAGPACAAGNPAGAKEQFDLGWQYMNGKGVPKDEKKASYWFIKAAKQGYASAQFNLGVRYEHGIGVSQSDRQAAAWYRKAAAQGHLDAINNYAYFLWTGKGVRKNEVEARRLFQQAVDNDSPIAQDNLAQMYRNGEGGLEQDFTEAVRLATAAAMTGNAYAQTRLGSWYAAGAVLPLNQAEAYYWSLLASRQGVEFARNCAADCRRALSPSQIANVEARAAAFRPILRRPRSQALDVKEFSIVPAVIPPGGRFDLVFRYTYTDPSFANGTPLPVEVSYEIIDSDSVRFTSGSQRFSQPNGETGQITKRNIKAAGQSGAYALILNLTFKYMDTASFSQDFIIP